MIRSARWFGGTDDTAFNHRVALRAQGIAVEAGEGRPVIGIADSASQLNPCNLPLADLAPAVAAGVAAAGGIPLRFPVVSLGEDLMKPTAMLYRNLLALEVEEMARAYPLDGLVLLAGCDKTVPGSIMGALSADLPAVVVLGGPRPAAVLDGRPLGSGTDVWRAWEDWRAGRIDDDRWARVEQAMSCGLGTCNVMGTASTMAVLTEVLGLALPGSGTVPAGSPQGAALAEQAGRRAVELVHAGVRPGDLVTSPALHNAATVLGAIAGSTNAFIHLAAIAGRVGLRLGPREVADAAAAAPVLVDCEPAGRHLVHAFHDAGGVPALLRELGDLVDLRCATVAGTTLADVVAAAPPRGEAIRPLDDPVVPGPAFAVVSGNLAPDGAVVKLATSSPALWRHQGPALVFEGHDDLRTRLDDPDLDVPPETVLVLRGAGPVGAPGMPEWGMLPIPAALARRGVTDMVRLSDARMSGTSFGTVFLHVAPEAAVGGPLALVRDGDVVEVDVAAGRLHLAVDEAELAGRRAAWRPPVPAHRRGWPALYQRTVEQADRGCDLDFLRPLLPEDRAFVEPVVGRS